MCFSIEGDFIGLDGMNFTVRMGEGEVIRWYLFYFVFYKGVVDLFLYNLGIVFLNYGLIRNGNERRDFF